MVSFLKYYNNLCKLFNPKKGWNEIKKTTSMALTGSIVLYKNNHRILLKAIYSFVNSPISTKLYIVDNSPTNKLKQYCKHPKINYTHNVENIGFGKAHNSILKILDLKSEYHLVMNPDIYFESNILESLISFIKADNSIGLLMPKILNPDGSLQRNCKLLPTPLNLITRRFLYWNKNFLSKKNHSYEMRFSSYDDIMEVPFLSGCFMFFRTESVRKIGFFDERFFLYGEDIDLSRRMFEQYKNIYFPKVHVYHHHEKGSYKSFKLMLRNIQSAVLYFNKWGWIDSNRKLINKKVTNMYHENSLASILEPKIAIKPAYSSKNSTPTSFSPNAFNKS